MYFQCDYTFLWSIQPLPLHSLILVPPTLNFSTTFNTYPYILYFHRCYILWYCWWSLNLFSFPSFPEFHRAVPLFQICPISYISVFKWSLESVLFNVLVFIYFLYFSLTVPLNFFHNHLLKYNKLFQLSCVCFLRLALCPEMWSVLWKFRGFVWSAAVR
jgi:hypothetical protein